MPFDGLKNVRDEYAVPLLRCCEAQIFRHNSVQSESERCVGCLVRYFIIISLCLLLVVSSIPQPNTYIVSRRKNRELKWSKSDYFIFTQRTFSSYGEVANSIIIINNIIQVMPKQMLCDPMKIAVVTSDESQYTNLPCHMTSGRDTRIEAALLLVNNTDFQTRNNNTNWMHEQNKDQRTSLVCDSDQIFVCFLFFNRLRKNNENSFMCTSFTLLAHARHTHTNWRKRRSNGSHAYERMSLFEN